MFLKGLNNPRNASGSCSFNMTPIIDIVFLLIIFFLVVCQFIEAENFPVAVPDGCNFAQGELEPGAQVTTVTVIRTVEGPSQFAVGPEKISRSDNVNVVDKLAELIDIRLEDLPADDRVITLRIDRNVCFAEAQYALAAVAASTATDIKLATFKDKRADPQ
ncbi:MAG: biopolymer transporter ExbD [Planctomycetota bacterium]|nr:MAG: biopolymer transporter ExbD [Planctomycetota bacterium]